MQRRTGDGDGARGARGSLPVVFALVLFAVAFVAGAVAALVGFGIGSLLTPLLVLPLGARLGVAAAALPHAAATALRCWRLRHAIDWQVLRTFGLASAGGGLYGAAAHGFLGNPTLATIFGLLLVLSGAVGLTGWLDRLPLRGRGIWIGGALSGLFGGLVGHQGGIRAAALLGFRLSPESFVATATATALLVDAVRLPVYAWTSGAELRPYLPLLVLATLGALLGTLAGERLFGRIPAPLFRRTVAATVLVLGLAMLLRGCGARGGGAAASQSRRGSVSVRSELAKEKAKTSSSPLSTSILSSSFR